MYIRVHLVILLDLVCIIQGCLSPGFKSSGSFVSVSLYKRMGRDFFHVLHLMLTHQVTFLMN